MSASATLVAFCVSMAAAGIVLETAARRLCPVATKVYGDRNVCRSCSGETSADNAPRRRRYRASAMSAPIASAAASAPGSQAALLYLALVAAGGGSRA